VIQKLRDKFETETGTHWVNTQGEPDVEYVDWLEKKVEVLLEYARGVAVDGSYGDKNRFPAMLKEAERMPLTSVPLVNGISPPVPGTSAGPPTASVSSTAMCPACKRIIQLSGWPRGIEGWVCCDHCSTSFTTTV